MSDSLTAYVAAIQAGGNAVYGDLKPGDLFVFPHQQVAKWQSLPYEKLKGGWYRLYSTWVSENPRYRTGSKTAVVKLS